MAGGGFMARVLHYVINEALVNGLANSPTFQRFAVRTSKRIENVTNIGKLVCIVNYIFLVFRCVDGVVFSHLQWPSLRTSWLSRWKRWRR
ncbi:AMP deaminase [Ranunculus cassubicifolius]